MFPTDISLGNQSENCSKNPLSLSLFHFDRRRFHPPSSLRSADDPAPTPPPHLVLFLSLSRTLSFPQIDKSEIPNPLPSVLRPAPPLDRSTPLSLISSCYFSRSRPLSYSHALYLMQSYSAFVHRSGMNASFRYDYFDYICFFLFDFFFKVQKTLRSPLVFDNFLRCILLYTKGIVTRIELFELIQSYLG